MNIKCLKGHDWVKDKAIYETKYSMPKIGDLPCMGDVTERSIFHFKFCKRLGCNAMQALYMEVPKNPKIEVIYK